MEPKAASLLSTLTSWSNRPTYDNMKKNIDDDDMLCILDICKLINN